MTIFLNPYTDFGFKKLFGEEASKPLLIDFLNSLLPEHHQIAELNFRNSEQLGANDEERKSVYDIYCQSMTGERFIVEMQKVGHKYFKDRTIYYSTFPIQEQAQKGSWDYNLSAVYCIGIVDFMLNEEQQEREVIHTINLKDQKNQVFYDKLTFIYLEMPSFHKTESQLKDRLDKWLFFLKHLENLQDVPNIFNDEVFIQAFDKARVASLKGVDYQNYQASLKALRDNYSALKTSTDKAREEGREEGRKEGIGIGREEGIELGVIKTAKSLKQMAMTTEMIQQATGLTAEQIEQL